MFSGYRLEQYSWRAQEDALNSELPQFRTAFTVSTPASSSSSPSETVVRTHFVHVKSPHANAIPLLLIPPFPASNLSFGHLIKRFTEPGDASVEQPFHLVIPALPGLGFSDALPNNAPAIPATAEILDSLMRRLAYPRYVVTNASAGSASPAGIDHRLVHHLTIRHSDSCVGAHLISPPMTRPKLKEAPLEWAKFSVARSLGTSVLGYRAEDLAALRSSKKARKQAPAAAAADGLGLREPNTLAYALCDSPTGLLVYVLMILRLLDPLNKLAPSEIISLTHLAWLPGPEAAMRFWAYCTRCVDESGKKSKTTRAVASSKPKVGITVFLGDEPATAAAAAADGPAGNAVGSAPFAYACPAWARSKYNVLYAQRAPGKPGLLAWQRPEVIAAGVRGLAAALVKTDSRLRPQQAVAVASSGADTPSTAPLEQVVVDSGNDDGEGAAPPRPVPEGAPAKPGGASQHLAAPPAPSREISDETAVGSHDGIVSKDKDPSPASSPAAESRPQTAAAGATDTAAASSERRKDGDAPP